MSTTSALLTNNAESVLDAGITNVATSMAVSAGDGAMFPNPGAGEYFYATLSNSTGTTIEIVKCTARSTDTLTIVRGQDGTTGQAFSAGDLVELRPIAELFREKFDALRGTWKLLYSDGSGVIQELALGAIGTILQGNGASSAPTFGSGIPPGSIFEYAAASAPTGYLLCDGSAVSRTTYAALFTAISTSYGVGDGSTTFNVPDRRGRVGVGYGTGTVTETQAAANFATTDIITVDSNPMDTKPKWLTGMKVQVTTSGVLPTGIAAATDHYVRRLSATTISLYDTLANAMDRSSATGIRNITATGSGNHTLTCTMAARALGDLFGAELTGDVPSHKHGVFASSLTGAGFPEVGTNDGSTVDRYSVAQGDPNGVTNMPPSIVMNYIIKT